MRTVLIIALTLLFASCNKTYKCTVKTITSQQGKQVGFEEKTYEFKGTHKEMLSHMDENNYKTQQEYPNEPVTQKITFCD